MKIVKLVFMALMCLGLASCAEGETASEPEIKPATWSDLLPSGFTTSKSRTDKSAVSEGFAYNTFRAGSYDCPNGFKRCTKVSVISEKGCPRGIFAVIVLEDEYGNELPGTILSEPNTANILADERTVLDFNVTGVIPDSLQMYDIVQVFNIGCND